MRVVHVYRQKHCLVVTNLNIAQLVKSYFLDQNVRGLNFHSTVGLQSTSIDKNMSGCDQFEHSSTGYVIISFDQNVRGLNAILFLLSLFPLF